MHKKKACQGSLRGCSKTSGFYEKIFFVAAQTLLEACVYLPLILLAFQHKPLTAQVAAN
jgi:hypothetical protein